MAGHARSRAQRGRLSASAACLFYASGIVPAIGAVERIVGPAPDRIAESILAPSGRLRVTLRNTAAAGTTGGGAPVQLRPQAVFSSVASGEDTPATWRRLDTGRGPDGDGRFQLAPSDTATFEVRGTFGTPGSWETAIEAIDTDGNVLSRIVLAIDRSIPAQTPIPATLLADPHNARIGLYPWEGSTEAGRVVLLQARNSTTEQLRLSGVTIGQVSIASGTTEVAAALTRGFSVGSRDCTGSLSAGQVCSVTLGVPAGLAPGRYAAEVIVSGEGGGQSARTQTIEVRASAWWAGGLAALGALLGALVTGWRSSGRQLVEARILAAERRRQAGLLEAATTVPAARRAIAHLMDRLRDLDSAIRRGTASSDLAPYDERLQALAAAVEAQAQAERIPPVQAQPIALMKAALETVLDGASKSTLLEAKASQDILAAAAALRVAVGETEALARAATEAGNTLALIRPTLRRILSQGAVGECVANLEDAQASAFLPLEPDATLAKRTDHLGQLVATLRAALTGTLVPDTVLGVLRKLHDATPDDQRTQDLRAALAAAKQLGNRWPALPLEARLREANHLAEAFADTFPQALESGAEAAAGPTPPVIPALLPAGNALTLDLDGLLSGPTRLASLDELEGFRTRWNRLTNLAVLVGIGAAAVPILWSDNSVWGTPTDLVTALLAGIGTRLAIGTVAPQS